MPPNPPASRGLPLDWSAMLDKVQEALRRAEVEAGERKRAYPIDSFAAESANRVEANWQEGMQRLEAHMDAMRSRLREQELQAGAVEAELTAGEEALRTWLAAVKEEQRSLANRDSSEV